MGWGANNDPIRGYGIVFVIAVVCVAIGDLNQGQNSTQIKIIFSIINTNLSLLMSVTLLN